MAFILADRVKESCSSPGTGTVTLLGAATGYQSFSAGIGANNTTYYVIADQGGANWEVGLGTIGAGGTTLARTTVLSSSNSGSLVNFASGTQDVFCDYTAKTALYVTNTGSQISLQAQATDSTATGGNARGANAVDWQTNRSAATQVASGSYTFIGGGTNNTAIGVNSNVVGGANNAVNYSYQFIGAGINNTISGSPAAVSAIVAGQSNSISGGYSSIVGGHLNTASGYFNSIVGGESNSATALAAVTTQVTTIAVTASTTLYLTSTNANIKVGQLILGTGITVISNSNSATYATSTVTTGTPAVMATSTISGTTLTVGSLTSGTIIAGQVLTGTGVTAGTYIVSGSGLSWVVSVSQTVASTTITGTAYTFTISQNATTAAGVTLSFYTPHGVVVGGGNNQATGAYSFIGGGGDAGTAANRNVASGDWSVVGGGRGNTASGIGAFVGSGGFYSTAGSIYNSTASGNSSGIVAGLSQTASGLGSFISHGYNNTANGQFSGAMGVNTTTRGLQNFLALGGQYNAFSGAGTGQGGLLIIAKQTTDATPSVLTTDGSGTAGTTNQVILPNNSAYYFKATVIANVTGGGNTKAWTLEGAIKRGSSVGTTAIVGSVTTNIVAADAGASTWTVTATADTANGGLAITFTGQASTTIRTVAKIETTEMTY